ncbi:MAG: hypothetical protein IPK82_07225 [Polyangiaceae bacterium]|nr:hypothetical protein [Polyangiaceae bacterium]
MEPQRISVKFAFVPPVNVPHASFILFFHRVIQDKLLPETLIDVADYSHVHNGPSVLLIGHEAHYSIDATNGQIGLKCAVKRGLTGSLDERIRRTFDKTLHLANLLTKHESLAGGIQVNTKSAWFSIEDRLAAPNTDLTFSHVAPVLASVATRYWGSQPVLSRLGTAKETFQVDISGADGSECRAPTRTLRLV